MQFVSLAVSQKQSSVGMPPDMARPAGRWRWKRVETGIIFPCQLGGGTNRGAAKSWPKTHGTITLTCFFLGVFSKRRGFVRDLLGLQHGIFFVFWTS